MIGGTAARTGNFISGNDGDGVELEVGTSGNRIEGNLIGTGQNGASDIGNGEAGVRVLGGPGNVIGGTARSARNVIAGNAGSGVSIGSEADGTTVQGNRIGPDVNGDDLVGETGNLHGVSISFGSSGNTIGGTASGAANTIAFNDNHEVLIEGFASGTTGNRISANSIHTNGLLGINLVGGVETNGAVTENDRKDPDAGPNLLQNFPRHNLGDHHEDTGHPRQRPQGDLHGPALLQPGAEFPHLLRRGADLPRPSERDDQQEG